jgi:hypothetical protein
VGHRANISILSFSLLKPGSIDTSLQKYEHQRQLEDEARDGRDRPERPILGPLANERSA